MSLDGAGRRVSNSLLMFAGIWVAVGLVLWLFFPDSAMGLMMMAAGGVAVTLILLMRFARKHRRGGGNDR